ncbi:hypothetical protein [Cupriavidus nantongensis]|uniref:Uncharacterized protein n=1 Tax=Cupriavidus nantongensis TaxID=1796606 RepID=A0A142JMZ3_9BURK|nr:hypothetical protein [Cupriavidus nantongensis]AMR79455.1 hypothetical protein A2G96_17855 [Cupriavidus nantongensis]
MADTPVVLNQPANDMLADSNPAQGGYVPVDPVAEKLNRPDAWDVAGATWRTETVIGQLMNRSGGGVTAPDPQFNPYAFLRENEQEYEFLKPLAAQGVFGFDKLQSKEEFAQYAQAMQRNLKDREIMATGNSNALLNFGVSLLDATTLVSGGAALNGVKAATLAGRMARGAAIVGTDAAIQEGVLQALDSTRPASDAFMNIGIGAALGAGIGPFLRHMPADSVLRPAHPDNPLRPENLDKAEMVEMRIGETPADSIGAMRATTGTEDTEIAVGKSKIAQAVDWALAPRWTPLGRATNYVSEKARQYLFAAYDTGGLLTKGDVAGHARPVEAETLKTIYDQETASVLRDVDSIYKAANMDLGQSALETSAKGLVNTWTLGKRSANTIGEDVFKTGVTIIQHGSNAGMTSADISKKVMKHLTDAGLTPEQAALVHKRVYEAEARYHESYEAMWNKAVKMGLADPALKGEGRYGMPQLWQKGAIDSNPEAFRAFMQEHLGSRPMDEWLMEQGYIKNPNAEPKLDADGKPIETTPHASWQDILDSGDGTLKNDILKDWRGEENDYFNARVAEELADAERRHKRNMENLSDVLRQLGKSETEARAARLSEVKAQAREMERGIVFRRVAAGSLKAERAEAKVVSAQRRLDAIGGGDVSDLQAALRETGEALDSAGPREAAATARVSEADALVADLKGQKADVIAEKKQVTADFPPNTAQKTHHMMPLRDEHYRLKAELRDAQAELKAAQDELAEAQADFDSLAKTQADTRRWLDAAAKDIDTIKSNEADSLLAPGFRAQEIDNMAALEELKRIADEATATRKTVYEKRRMLGDDVKAARKAANRSASQLRVAKSRARKGSHEAPPLTKYVQQLSENLRGQAQAPRGLLLENSPVTGRLKERKFQFNEQEYDRLRELGFLESNAADAFQKYMQDMGGQMALHQAWGGKKIEDVIREVEEDLDRMIGSAKPEDRKTLAQQRDLIRDDLKAASDRLLGRYDVKDQNGVVWIADSLRQLGLVRFMGGFIFAAIGDIATAAWAAPGSVTRALTGSAVRDMKYIVEQAAKGDKDFKQLERILGSFETGLHMSQSDKALGLGAVRDHIGFGTGKTKEITGNITKYLDLVADAGNRLSGLAAYSNVVRRAAGLAQLANIAEWTKGYDKLSPGIKADLAAVGIGEVEAKRLAELFAKHGSEERRGLFNPGMSKWLSEPDGDEMKEVLEAALVKAQKRASYTSGYGNQPLLMDKWYGKLFLQFQSTAFQFTNNFLRAGFQRGAVTGEHAKFAQALGIVMAAGVVMNVLSSMRKGQDPTEQTPHEMAYNTIQRSGVLGYLGSFVDAGVKLSDPVTKEHLGFTLAGKGSRYSQGSWASNLVGPWFGNLETLSQAGANAVNGDLDQFGKKMRSLVPLQQQYGFIKYIFGANDDD